MTSSTLLLLIISFGVALGLSFFQYYYKAKSKSKVILLLAFLRFLSILSILILLINPIINKSNYEIVKAPLAIAIDNSSSISELGFDKIANNIYEKLNSNKALKDKFDVSFYEFDNQFSLVNNFNFIGKQTNIENVAKNLKSIYKNQFFPTVLITDGNQTSGSDYVFSFNENNKIFPVVLGDTTKYLDLKISQLNVNKYAFHKNQFPVEVFINYSGKKNINATLKIENQGQIVNSQVLKFSPSKNATTVNLLLPANKIGLQTYKATVLTSEKEKNTYNNSKNFAIEVINQKSEVALISTINHPDLGVIKRSIETNVQRKVSILNPKDAIDFSKYSVVILYQPNIDFKQVYENITRSKINTFTITGNQTDFDFLNKNQSLLHFKMTNQKEDYLASYNDQFNLFSLDNLGFEQFPPLENPFGVIKVNQDASILLFSKTNNIDNASPLLIFSENQQNRNTFLLGEGLWKWRMSSHLQEKSFAKYDQFFDKIMQFLVTNGTKKSLIVNHENFYNSSESIEINAQYFNKNYEFDENAKLNIMLVNKKTNKLKSYDLLKSNNNFKINLDGLAPGKYNFTITELNSKNKYQNSFEVIDFDIEKQFVNPDIERLNQLATVSEGKLFFPNQTEQLVKKLLETDTFKPIQKKVNKRIPLIDSIYLLILLIITLSAEWFIRKYNGML